MPTDETPGYPEDATEQSAPRAALEAEQRLPTQDYRFSCPNPRCQATIKVVPEYAEQVRAAGKRGVDAKCGRCKTLLLVLMQGGELTAIFPPDDAGQGDDATEIRDHQGGGNRRRQAVDEVNEPPPRRAPDGSPTGLGRDWDQFIRGKLQALTNDLQTGLEPLGTLQAVVEAIPDNVSVQVRKHVAVVAQKIEELQKSVDDITENLGQFVNDVQVPIVEKLDTASEAVTTVLQKVDAHTTQSAQQHTGLAKRLSTLGEKLDELGKITRKLYAAFDPVIDVQNKRLAEMNAARDNELKNSNRERHDELMKMHDELFKTNEAIKATHEAGMQELRGKFAELRSSYEAFRESFLGNTAKLDEFSNRHLSDDVLTRLAACVREVVTSPESLRASFGAYFATLSRQDDNHRRLHLLEQLPALLDAVEGELNNWRQLCESGSGDDTARKILEVLEGVQSEIGSWLVGQGLERFADRNQQFDRECHTWLRSAPTTDETLVGRIKDVVRSGYRFKDGKQVLRKADVVVWGK
jgi:molecular chaperone GrpE (heat shock protein)